MTDTMLDRDPNDTGEIPRITPGEVRTQIARRDPGEATQNIAGWDAGLPPRLRRSDAHIVNDDTEVFIGWPTGAEVVVQQRVDTGARLYDFNDLRPPAPGPGPFPKPLPPDPNPPAPRPSVPPQVHPRDLAAAQPVAPWERVAGAAEVQSLRRSVPYVMPEGYRRRGWFRRGRHAAPGPLWLRVASWAGLALGIGAVLSAALALVALAVFL